MNKSEHNQLLKTTIITVMVIIVLLFYYYFDPSEISILPPCPIKTLTGWRCWGCGGQRAFHQLLHGNFRNAFQHNALVFPVALLSCFVLVTELSGGKRSYRLLRLSSVRIMTLVIFASFTILRNMIP